MRTQLLTTCAILLQVFSLFGQDQTEKPNTGWRQSLHLDAGLLFPTGSIKESIAVRQNISYYYANHSSDGYVSAETSVFTTAVKWEFFNPRILMGFASGLRYTGFNTEISGYTARNADFYYLRYSMHESDTKFARVKSITESNNFISVPVEVTFIPLKYEELSLFVRAGVEFSLLNIKHATDIDFHNEEMEIQKDVILSVLADTPDKFYSTLYGSLGLMYTQEDKPNFVFEVILPVHFLSKNNFAFTEIDNMAGFKFSVQIPVIK
jgi:hypothetical protein